MGLLQKVLRNSLGDGEEIHREALHAHITLIAKERKHPTVCASYRPISLINEDKDLCKDIGRKAEAPYSRVDRQGPGRLCPREGGEG